MMLKRWTNYFYVWKPSHHLEILFPAPVIVHFYSGIGRSLLHILMQSLRTAIRNLRFVRCFFMCFIASEMRLLQSRFYKIYANLIFL